MIIRRKISCSCSNLCHGLVLFFIIVYVGFVAMGCSVPVEYDEDPYTLMDSNSNYRCSSVYYLEYLSCAPDMFIVLY